MSEKLTKFLIELSKDPLKRQQFDSDPAAVMSAEGLNAADQRLLLTKNPALVRARFGAEAVAHMTVMPPQKPPKKKKTAKKKTKKKK
jgi:hypothetical protein